MRVFMLDTDTSYLWEKFSATRSSLIVPLDSSEAAGFAVSFGLWRLFWHQKVQEEISTHPLAHVLQVQCCAIKS